MPKPKVSAKLPLSYPLELQLDDLLRRKVIIKYQISVPRTFLPIIGDFQRLLIQSFAIFFKNQTKLISSEIQCNPENLEKKNYSIKVVPRHCW
jgi:hypothetical protein